MDLAFNELSLAPAFGNNVDASEAMIRLAETLASGVQSRFLSALRTDTGFLTRILAPDYSIGNWLNDRSVDREAKRLILSTATKAPYLESLFDELQGDRLAEFRHQGNIALGLGVAVLLDVAAVSLSSPAWRIDPITVEATYATEEGLEEESNEACNIYSAECWTRRRQWFEDRAIAEVEDGPDILNDANGLFRFLRFGETARGSLKAYVGREAEFRSVVRHLLALSRQAEGWQGGLFLNGYSFRASAESEATLNKFGAQRDFRCPDGVIRRFSLHSKISVKATRIYFLPQQPGEPVIIGYIGPHLDIATG